MRDRVGQPREVAHPRQRPRLVSDDDARRTSTSAAETGDLFAHFGVALEAPGTRGPRPLVEVVACSHCSWWLSASQVTRHESCPVCGTPS